MAKEQKQTPMTDAFIKAWDDETRAFRKGNVSEGPVTLASFSDNMYQDFFNPYRPLIAKQKNDRKEELNSEEKIYLKMYEALKHKPNKLKGDLNATWETMRDFRDNHAKNIQGAFWAKTIEDVKMAFTKLYDFFDEKKLDQIERDSFKAGFELIEEHLAKGKGGFVNKAQKSPDFGRTF